MVDDSNATDTAPETDSLDGDGIFYGDWLTAAGSTIEASINTKLWPSPLVASFQQIATIMLDDILSEFAKPTAIVSLCLCDDAQMQQLNHRYRKIDKPTNVLSFPACDMAEQKVDWLAPVLLGDIVIAAETLVQEANDMQIPVVDHLLHLFLHGALHLFGHDHIDDDLAKTMESLEVKFLANVGVPNPYQVTQMEIHK